MDPTCLRRCDDREISFFWALSLIHGTSHSLSDLLRLQKWSPCARNASSHDSDGPYCTGLSTCLPRTLLPWTISMKKFPCGIRTMKTICMPLWTWEGL